MEDWQKEQFLEERGYTIKSWWDAEDGEQWYSFYHKNGKELASHITNDEQFEQLIDYWYSIESFFNGFITNISQAIFYADKVRELTNEHHSFNLVDSKFKDITNLLKPNIELEEDNTDLNGSKE